MSTLSETRIRKRKAAGGAFKAPLTVSAPALIEDGHDRRFRKLVHDLITIAVRLETVRDMLGRRMDVSGPQYSILMVVAQNQGRRGVAVRAVADQLHVSGAFVTSEVGKLVRAGLIGKQANPEDRRSVLLSLTAKGEALIRDVAEAVRATNDRFFGALDRDDFLILGHIVDRMVGSSRAALGYLSVTAPHPPALRAGRSLSQGRGAKKPRPSSAVRARDLPEPRSEAERVLWSALRDRQLGGHDFRRCHPIGPYVVDFCCVERKLIVEVEGRKDAPDDEERRLTFLEDAGYRLVLLWDSEVLGNMEVVLLLIADDLSAGPHPPVADATGPSLSRGRGSAVLPSPLGEGGARSAPGEATREKARPASTTRVRDLRKSSTKAERALWAQLRDRQLDGHKFRRQQPIGPYVVDFFCLERKLVVEVDGGQHAPEVDERRTAFLKDAGYRVLRFWNEEVLGSMDGVLQTIAEELRGRASPSRR
jgi:very-short-patch-repair endonuclease/DNA-binding MarR family transcriptional regulator